MKLGTIARIIGRNHLQGSLRNRYWRAAGLAVELRALFRPANKAFRKVVVADQVRFMFGAGRPIAGQTVGRARAAVQWILRAQAATPDDGVALGLTDPLILLTGP